MDLLVVPPTFSARCALCWEAFELGDRYRSVWRRGRAGQHVLGISVHPGCFDQLEAGDLTRIFVALERRLGLPIAVLNGRRVVADVSAGARSTPAGVTPDRADT